MPRAIARPSESTLNLRIDAALKQDFVAVVEAEDRPAAEVLRALIRGYVEEARKRRFAAEARRQSQLIAASEDEAEVMRWIQDVSAPPDGFDGFEQGGPGGSQ
jgi:antitoxin component of RelBE/YafQ-DinJ toxin-antitoxin module